MKTIILLSGHMRSGKNTFADFMIPILKAHGVSVTQDSFANGVKNGSKEDFNNLIKYINGHIDRIKAQIGVLFNLDKITPQATLGLVYGLLDQLKTVDSNWFEDKNMITRLLLQAYGTEIFRNRVDEDWWANQFKNKFMKSDSQITIATDCRFPGEIDIFNELNEYNVITIRINRDVKNSIDIINHPSEIALDRWTSWNYVIENNGTLQDLHDSANVIVQDILNNL